MQDLIICIQGLFKCNLFFGSGCFKSMLNEPIVYTYVLETHKWFVRPCKKDYHGRDFDCNLVPTKPGVWKRRIKNETSASLGGDLAWVPLELKCGGMSIFNMPSTGIPLGENPLRCTT